MRLATVFSTLLCGLLAAGCGDDGDDRETQAASTTQVQYLQAAVDDLGAIATITTDADTAGGANATLSNLYASYNSMANEVIMQQQSDQAAQLVPYSETVPCSIGSYTWDESSVTYDNCDGITGSVSWSGDTFTLDITYDFGALSMGTYTGSMEYSGELTITETQIDGNLDLAYTMDMDTMGYVVSYDSDYAITYDAVGLDSTGCPESGTLDMEGSWAYSASGQDYSESFHITSTFNSCGDVTVAY